MKRFIKWFIDWLKEWFLKLKREERIGFSLGGVLGVIAAIMIFVAIDKVPATTNDYEQLHQQATAIEQNPDLLFKADCNINVNSEIITVKFENDECKMTAQYDQNFELLSTSEKDKSVSWIIALGCALLLGFMIYGFGSVILIVLIYLIEILWQSIYKKLKK